MPKAHLIVKHLKGMFEGTTTLSMVGAKCDLEACVMKKGDHPNDLFEKLVEVQFKYAGVKQARITEADLVIQAIQALPAEYNPTVAVAMEKAREQDPKALISVINHFEVAMKGRPVVKSKEIEGALAAVDETKPTDKENLKRMIQETVNTIIHEFHIQHQVSLPRPAQVGYGMAAVGHGGPPPTYNGVGPGGQSGYGVAAASNDQATPPPQAMSNGITAEMMLAIIQAAKGSGGGGGVPAQIDTTTMLCYCCGQYGHRTNDCKNPKNHELVKQVLMAQGKSPCEHCGRFGHHPSTCWSLPANAGARPQFWRPPGRAPVQPVGGQGQGGQPESGAVSVDFVSDGTTEFSLALGVDQMEEVEVQSIDASLKAMGMCLASPDVWIGDTGATTHNTAYIVGAVNQRQASELDNIVGITGPPAEAKTIVDIPCEMVCGQEKKNVMIKDVTYVPNSRYNLFSLTKLMANGWTMIGGKDVGIKMVKGLQSIVFDKTVHTPKGLLYVAVMKRRVQETGQVEMKKVEEEVVDEAESGWFEHGAVADKQPLPITISRAHAMCGHMGQVEARGVCEYFGQEISKQGFQKCVSCGKAKMKQKTVTQDNSEHVVAGPEGHRMFIDISSVKHGSERNTSFPSHIGC
jgi:hypothetical protein